MKRRIFIRNSTQAGIGFSLLGIYSCKDEKKVVKEEDNVEKDALKTTAPFFKLSLAQWSLNKAVREGGQSPLDFAQKASELGFEGIEYVSQLYTKELEKDKDLRTYIAEQNLL